MDRTLDGTEKPLGGTDPRPSKQQVREARQKARAIDKANDKSVKEKDKKEKKGKGGKKQKKGKAVFGFAFIATVSAWLPRRGDAAATLAETQFETDSGNGSPSDEQPAQHALPNATVATAAPASTGAGTAPRVLSFVVIKRIDPRFPSTWGHWWVEVDGEESYGWWPLPCPLGLRRTITGARGTLNGLGARTDGTATRDPYHGDPPDHAFHPTLVVAKSDNQVRADIRRFAQSYSGGWCWNWWWLRNETDNCRTFQSKMFEAVGLVEEPEYLYTHGPGCPFMYLFRSAKWRAQDVAAAAIARVRPRPSSTGHRRTGAVATEET